MASARTTGWTRREFIRTTGTAVLTLGLANLDFACKSSEPPPETAPIGQQPAGAATPTPAAVAVPDYRSWEDVFRTQWTWDRVVRGTHTMTNCTSGCAWNLYVKDNIVWREEQQSPYAASSPGLLSLSAPLAPW